MQMAKHAVIRARQRGFSAKSLHMIWKYGRHSFAPGGAIKYFFGNKEYRYAYKTDNERGEVIERAKNGTIVVVNGMIITAYKK